MREARRLQLVVSTRSNNGKKLDVWHHGADLCRGRLYLCEGKTSYDAGFLLELHEQTMPDNDMQEVLLH